MRTSFSHPPRASTSCCSNRYHRSFYGSKLSPNNCLLNVFIFRHMKSSDPHPSDEESAHSFKYSAIIRAAPFRFAHTSIVCRWLIIKRPTYFSAAQVESQDPLPSPKYTFVDLMNAAPHLAATVQRNVAISMASDLLEKASDAKSNPTPAIKSSGAITGSTKANSAKAHPAKVPDPPPKGVEKAASAPVLDALGYVKAPGQPPANAKLEPHIPPKKRKSKFSKDATGPISRAPNALSSNAGVPQAGSVGKDRAIPKAPLSSSINLKLSKKLVHSATHVYIANFISSKKKAEEHQKKAQEKQYQSQLRQQQQQQIVQQNQLQQQQQIQQQLQNQQQMMQLFQRSQHGQALQHQDAYLSHTGASMAQTFNPVASSGSSAKAQVRSAAPPFFSFPCFSLFHACSVPKTPPNLHLHQQEQGVVTPTSRTS